MEEEKNNDLKRRSFIGKLSKTGLLICLPFKQLDIEAIEDKKTVTAILEENTFITEPYLQNLTFTSVTIMWISANNSLSWVEINKSNQPARKVLNSKNGLIASNDRVHKIRIDGLDPDSIYHYSIFSREIEDFQPYKVVYGKTIKKGQFTFKTSTLKDDQVSFLVFNDLHDHPENITELMDKFCKEKDYDFVVFNGDAFNWVDNEERIVRDLLVPAGKVFSSNCPFLMVQGNHEPRGSYARQMFDYFDYPSDSCYNAFTLGPVRFIVMDSGEDKEDDHPEYSGLISYDAYREKQAKWLETEIMSDEFKKASFRVVFIHIPIFHAGEAHGTLHCRKLFNPLFNKGKIDLAISGHTHRYGTFAADEKTHNYPILIGGGPGFVGRGGGIRTLIKAKATKKKLLIEMLIDDGTVVGSFNLNKS